MELLGEIAGPSHDGPSVSFGAPAGDQISIAASKSGLESGGDEDSAVLPPSGRVALIESDPKLTVMFSRAAEIVGLRVPRLDNWYLGAAHANTLR